MKKTAQNQRKLLSPEREQLILDALGRGVQTISELSLVLNVSEATVRRDLLSLEERNLAQRVHGGAVPIQTNKVELRFNEKATRFAKEKVTIANVALDMINDGDTIYLDGGSTVLELVKKLDKKNNLTIITNSLMAASELMDSSHKLIVLGGEFRPLSRTLVGSLTAPLINSIYVDKAFFGTIGICQDGLFTTDSAEAFTKKNMVERADQIILLADSSKIGLKSLVKSGELSDIDTFITDENIPVDFIKYLNKNKCNLIKVNLKKGEKNG